MAITTKEVELSIGKTRYLESGSPAGQPVILFHGVAVAGGADDFRPVMVGLGDKYRLLTPDFIGWAPTPARPDTDAFPYLTDHIREFQDALNLKSSHVVGATMGGWIAGLFAYESPNRVDKLVMTGNPGFHGSANNALNEYKIPTEEQVRASVKKVCMDLSEDEQEDLIQQKLRALNEPGHAEAHSSMMKTMGNGQNRLRFTLLRRLPHVTAPTLFLLGKGDPSSEHGEELQKLVPGSKLHIVEDGAHQVHYENTPEFCREVSAFLG